MPLSSPTGFFADLRRIIRDAFLGVPWDERQERTFEILFRLLGHLARLDGLVTAEERSVAVHAMDTLDMPLALRARALAAFDVEPGDAVEIRREIERYLEEFHVGSPQLRLLCDCLKSLAAADGHVDSRERAFLEELDYVLGITDDELRRYSLAHLLV
jgi:DnaJ like chaperone protein